LLVSGLVFCVWFYPIILKITKNVAIYKNLHRQRHPLQHLFFRELRLLYCKAGIALIIAGAVVVMLKGL